MENYRVELRLFFDSIYEYEVYAEWRCDSKEDAEGEAEWLIEEIDAGRDPEAFQKLFSIYQIEESLMAELAIAEYDDEGNILEANTEFTLYVDENRVNLDEIEGTRNVSGLNANPELSLEDFALYLGSIINPHGMDREDDLPDGDIAFLKRKIDMVLTSYAKSKTLTNRSEKVNRFYRHYADIASDELDRCRDARVKKMLNNLIEKIGDGH